MSNCKLTTSKMVNETKWKVTDEWFPSSYENLMASFQDAVKEQLGSNDPVRVTAMFYDKIVARYSII